MFRIFTATSAVVALTVFLALAPVQRLAAQDARGTAGQYLDRLLLTQGDSGLTGYRRTGSRVLGESRTDVLAGRAVYFDADPPGPPRVLGFLIEAFVFTSVEGAQSQVAAYRNAHTDREDDGSVVRVTWQGSLTGVEQGEWYRFDRFFPASGGNKGVGAAWRRGAVFLRISAYTTPQLDPADETLRLANVQDDKAERIGPVSPPTAATMPSPSPATPTTSSPPPSTPAPSTPSGPPSPSMGVIGTALRADSILPDGTTIAALINGRECGSTTTDFGFFLLSVASDSEMSGCGTIGARVTFTVNGAPAAESVMWGLDNVFTPLELTVAGGARSTGRVVRPVLIQACPPLDGRACNGEEQALWRFDLRAWLARGLSSAEEIAAAWLKFRAERGETFGKMMLETFLRQEPYTFLSAVQYAPSADEPEPYVMIVNVGTERSLGGWTLTTERSELGADPIARYTFPSGFVLPIGTCRIYLGSRGNPTGNTCPDAFFGGEATELATSAFGYVILTDDTGLQIDVVSWEQ